MVLIRSHDALFRFVFGEPEQMADLLRIQLPAAVTAAIDWPSSCRVEGTFVDKALQARHSDLLFTASVAGGDVLLYVLCEHKSAPEPLVPLQLARYVVRIHDRWVADHPGTCRLPVGLPFLFHHGERPWTGAASVRAWSRCHLGATLRARAARCSSTNRSCCWTSRRWTRRRSRAAQCRRSRA
jgi:predicted transposase YdaD